MINVRTMGTNQDWNGEESRSLGNKLACLLSLKTKNPRNIHRNVRSSSSLNEIEKFYHV